MTAAGPSVRTAQRLPAWLGSIRVRVALLYSFILFGLAALVLAAVYFMVARAVQNEPIWETVDNVIRVPGGYVVERQYLRNFEADINQATLVKLRNYSLGSLGVLFVGSLVVGWFVAAYVLRPIERITGVARDIQATDLSRRIDLGGPDDELKQLADTFDAMLARIDDAFESQRQFIHEASHELRNPLAVIRTNLEVTLADPDATEDDLRHTAEVVQKSTDRIARLVDDLLVYSRKGSLSLERHPLDAAEVVAEAADEFAVPARDKGIELTHAAVDGLWLEGDRLALRQALANLLANAVRLSPPDTTIRVTAGREGPWIWMAVADEGLGIAPADQERVFQRFWRGDPTEGRDAGRSGLGLTIVRQVAEAHGGTVRLVSELGRGAVFALWLPAAPAPVASAASPMGASET